MQTSRSSGPPVRSRSSRILRNILAALVVGSTLATGAFPQIDSAAIEADQIYDLVEHHYADSRGVKIHYVTIGEGPVVLFIHGFPDQWYTWRYQMAALADSYRVVAMSQRGYNRSDKPKGVENYTYEYLLPDVAAVLDDVGAEKATLVAHDWGGNVAWNFSFAHPERVERLVIFNRPHPQGRNRELALDNEQKKNSRYIVRFKNTTGDAGMTAEQVAERYRGSVWYERYLEAFRRSDFEAMINYYRANYPDPPFLVPEEEPVRLPFPVLMFHGLDDRALGHGALNHTWEWLDGDLTLVTLPGVGHNSHNTGPYVEFATGMLESWLELERHRQESLSRQEDRPK